MTHDSFFFIRIEGWFLDNIIWHIVVLHCMRLFLLNILISINKIFGSYPKTFFEFCKSPMASNKYVLSSIKYVLSIG
jgi:hypothetical protein